MDRTQTVEGERVGVVQGKDRAEVPSPVLGLILVPVRILLAELVPQLDPELAPELVRELVPMLALR